MSGRTGRIVIGLIAAAVAVGVIAGAYIWFSGGSGQASRTLEAPTLVVNATATTSPNTPEATQALIAADTAEATPEEAPIAAANTAEATNAVSSASEPASESTEAAATSGSAIFNIVSEESRVQFSLDEELRGLPNTVVGRTNQIAGQILVDFENPAASQLGTIRVNARTLTTDDEFRNRAIRSFILESAQDAYEFIDFAPTAIQGMPEQVTIGEPINFQVVGDLTIRSITRSVTFDVTVTPVSEERLEGTATTTVQRADFELTIPSVPTVANVAEAVLLEINFVATREA